MVLKPRDVKVYPELEALARSLCNKDNHVDGILILLPKKSDDPYYLRVDDGNKIQGIDTEAFAGEILQVLESAEELVISDNKGFETGDIKTIMYEYKSLVFVIYNMGSEDIDNPVYLVLINSDSMNLGSFNANRPRVKADMRIAMQKIDTLPDLA